MTVNWQDAPTEFTRRCVLCQLWGPTGSGKTTWALKSKPPIALIHRHEKIDGIVEEFARQKTIKMVSFSCDYSVYTQPADKKRVAKAKWELVAEAFREGLSWNGTVIVDTDTFLYETRRYMEFGTAGKADAPSYAYGPIYLDLYGLLCSAFKEHVQAGGSSNVILIGSASDEYIGKNKTGNLTRAGYKDVSAMAEVGVRLECNVGFNGEVTYTSTVEKCWMNSASMGKKFEGIFSSFPSVLADITGTDYSLWAGEEG